MKKHVLFIFSFLFISAFAFGQSLIALSAEGEPLPQNNHVAISGDPSQELVADCIIKNTSEAEITVGIKMYVDYVQEGSNFQLCFSDGCLPPGNYSTDKTVVMASQATDNSFSCHYNYNDNLGMASAMFTFYNTADENDSVSVFYVFTTSYLALLSEDGQPVEGGNVIRLNTHPDSGEMEVKMQVKNLKDEAIDVMVAKKVLIDLENSMNTFCWGACFPPNVDTCNSPLTIEAGAVNENDFSAHFNPNGVEGVAEIEYMIYDANNPSDKITIRLAIFSQDNTAINDLSAFAQLSAVYPNPVASSFSIDYSFEQLFAQTGLEIYNVTGARVAAYDIYGMSGRMDVAVDDLENGVYFCVLKAEGQVVKMNKFVIAR